MNEVKIGQIYQECSAYAVEVVGLAEGETVIVKHASIIGVKEIEMKQSDDIFKPEFLVK